MEQLVDKSFFCKTPEETKDLAKKIALAVPANSSVALVGDLGAGKTTFVKGLANGFGIAEEVNSPSFNILHMYRRNVLLLHVDAYRLDGGERSAEGLMLDDFLIPPYCLVVEWPENLHKFLESCHFLIYFEIAGKTTRKIVVKRGAAPLI